MRAVFCDRSLLRHMVAFELALARALAKAECAPATIVPAIERGSNAAFFDLDNLACQARLAGNIAIPFIKAFTKLVGEIDPDAAKFVHWGATSQDVLDTALVLQLQDALRLIDGALSNLSEALARLVEKHKATALAGRTWLQQGPPVTLGLKAAGWLSAIERHRKRLKETAVRARVIQFGGAVGTLSALGERAVDVSAALACELKLEEPDLSWHTHRDRIADVVTNLGLLGGTLGKIARDISLLMQTEVAEAFEPMVPGAGASSTMPHKRNPVLCAVILAASLRMPGLVSTTLTAMVQEHERGLGGWHAEWLAVPEACKLAAGALAHTLEMIDGLEVDEQQMAANLEATRGLILSEAVAFALARQMGRLPAHRLVEDACSRAVEEGRSLRDVLSEDARVQKHLSAAEIARLLDPRNYLGCALGLVEKALLQRSKSLGGISRTCPSSS